MKFENTEVYGFKRALKGMRNPLESWHKNDTVEAVSYTHLINSNMWEKSSNIFIHIAIFEIIL